MSEIFERNKKPEAPYMWASKTALRKVSELSSNKSRDLTIYFALCWLASDKKANTFPALKSEIVGRCGLSKRTVETGLYELWRMDVIRIKREKLPGRTANAPNVYRLISMQPRKRPAGSGLREPRATEAVPIA